MMRQMNGRDY
ncbi:Protein of unknown function [Bacillus mycoides]|uniref:Uncharacterized protein n=1 Tax=Bacillus mycoides TaxID=1405 RepID=A0A1G4ERP3_BACMY|nr:Protein of unknown function [Bacillus mycoides]